MDEITDQRAFGAATVKNGARVPVPDLARRVGMETFARDALVSFGIFCAAADTLAREAATVH